ncbi:hypothetical protein HK102_012236 [Quaeritorhiza haematococci]|nr:hypothetical protein HK102_012236 [Quaeritorhiza haematococci]
MRSLSLVLLLGTVSLQHLPAPVAAQQPTSTAPCNGWVELCSKPYNAVLFPMTHNSFAVGPSTPPPPAASQNQDWTVARQLLDGVRAFEWDLHSKAGTIHLCHGPCDEPFRLDAGPLSNYINVLKTFMEQNPREVITIMLENADKFDAPTIAQNFADVLPFVYTPQGAQWPTLGELIEQNKRLVIFTDNGVNLETHPWLLPALEYVTSSSFQVFTPTGFECDAFYPGPPRKALTRLNHFLNTRLSDTIYFADFNSANVTNSRESLQAHINSCKGQNVFVNFLAVDFGATGDLLQVVASENGVQLASKAPTVGGSSGGSSTTGSVRSSSSPSSNTTSAATTLVSTAAGYGAALLSFCLLFTLAYI